MSVEPGEFFRRLEGSGLLSDSIIKRKESLLQAPSGEAAAADLVRRKLLTDYQSQVLVRGESIPLVIGDYVVTDAIGRGGMGYVLKALHRRMKRPVAIKFLLKSLTESDDLKRRFEREVEAAAQLNHQNIVTAYDAGVHDGNHYLVMQYVDGDDLSHIVKSQGILSIPEAVDVIRQAALGLGFAHDKGIVHRDIKPGNLLIDADGVVRILDMGLARMKPSMGDRLEGGAQADLTSTGSIMGTIDYMAPEQAMDSKSVDHRADIYALGCTLFFLLTGHPPFRNDTVMRRLLAHREQEIPKISSNRPDAPPELDGIFAMMMAKKKEDRFPSMQHLIVALDSLELSDTDAEQMATLDMPDSGNGGFISLPDNERTSVADADSSGFEDAPSDRHRNASLSGTNLLGSSSPHSASTAEEPTLIESGSRKSVSVVAGETDSMIQAETFAGVVLTEPAASSVAGRRPRLSWKLTLPAVMIPAALLAVFLTSENSPEPVKPSAVRLSSGEVASRQAPAVAIKGTGGTPGPATATSTVSVDRRAAETVLKLGGTVSVQIADRPASRITDSKQLPDELFAVTEIDLSRLPGIADENLADFLGLTELQSLLLSQSPITDHGLAILTDAGQRSLPALTRLYLDGTSVSQNGLRYLSGSTELRGLLLDDTAISQAAVLEQFPKLNMLGLSRTLLAANELRVIRKLPQLARLYIDADDFSGEAISGVEGWSRLRDLVLYDLTYHLEPGILTSAVSLQSLGIHSCAPEALDDAFWESVAGLDELENLYFTYGMTDQSLAGALPMPQLRVFGVTSKAVSGPAVAEAMSKFPNVTFLKVTHSGWTDNDIQQLHTLKLVRQLDLRGNTATTSEGLEALHAALPDCQIQSDYGTFAPDRSQRDPASQ